jgi:hypothetical protein
MIDYIHQSPLVDMHLDRLPADSNIIVKIGCVMKLWKSPKGFWLVMDLETPVTLGDHIDSAKVADLNDGTIIVEEQHVQRNVRE